ncbi:radical SAM protein, partial [Lachnotalea glycerini]
TNMSEKDINRIIEYKMSPINISFQTTNPKLRCEMLHNRFAGDALKKVDRFYEAGIEMNGQIVLCKGINDGKELERSIQDMSQYIPHLKSVSIVPVGLTKFREGLWPLEPFSKEDSKEVLAIIHKWQKKLFKKYGTHFIHAGDEWYIMANEKLPEADNYDGYLQLENGVGMVRLLLDEFEEEYSQLNSDNREHMISIATGVSAYSYIKKMA